MYNLLHSELETVIRAANQWDAQFCINRLIETAIVTHSNDHILHLLSKEM